MKCQNNVNLAPDLFFHGSIPIYERHGAIEFQEWPQRKNMELKD